MKNTIAFFFFSPFIGLIQALKHYRENWAKNSVWLFVVFYGYTMFRPEAMDATRYVLKLQELYGAPLNWDVFISNFYSEDGQSIDIYQPLVTYLLAFVTDNGNILFAVFGIVFGYFYSRNIWLMLDLLGLKETNKTFWLLVIGFACVIGFWNLNGVRMWTAAHIFFFGTFNYIVHHKKSGIFIALTSIMVHFSFVLPVGILFLFMFIKIPWRVLYFFFIASFSISTLNISAFRSQLENIAPEFLIPRVKSYTSDEYVEVISDINASANWYITYYGKSINWLMVILFTIIYFSRLKNNYSKSFSDLFGFSLLFLSVGNITSLLPSGGRYLFIAQLFGMALLIYFYVRYENKLFDRWLMILSPLLLFFIIVSIRVSFDTVTFLTLFTNPLIASFVDVPIPIIDLFK